MSVASTVSTWTPGVVETGVPFVGVPVHESTPVVVSLQVKAALTTCPGVSTAPFVGEEIETVGGVLSITLAANTLMEIVPVLVWFCGSRTVNVNESAPRTPCSPGR